MQNLHEPAPSSLDALPVASGPEHVPLEAPVYIYGAGSLGHSWLAALADAGLHRVAGIADTFATGTMGGHRILDADALAERVSADGGHVILASHAWRDIAGTLVAQGVSRLYNGSPLVAGAASCQPPAVVQTDPAPTLAVLSEAELRLTKPHLIQRFILELTDSCTFRCLYCHQNIPGFTPSHTMADDLFDSLIGFLKRHRLNVTVDLTGAGDLTMAPRWRERCDAILDAGVSLTATVNLARTLTIEELETFSRFKVLAVSCDTLDPAVFRSIRRSMDIRTIVYNLMAIRSIGVRRGVDEPSIMITATYCAEMVGDIDLLAAFAVAVGAKSFGVQDLVEHTATEHNVRSVWTLTGETAANAVARTRLALDIVARKGLALSLQPEFLARLDTLDRSVREGLQGPVKADCGRDVTYMEPMRPGFTRDCTDPWTFLQILGDGTVRPCCFSPTVLGRIDGSTSLEEIQNSRTAHALRDNLLTGTVDAFCSACNFRKQVPTEEYRSRIQLLVSQEPSG